MQIPHQYREFFLKNLSIIKLTDPELATRLDKLCPSLCYEWLNSEIGAPTLQITGGKTPIILHSKHDPLREAKREIHSLAIDSPSLFVCLGVGLGYSLEVLWENHFSELTGLLLVERDIELFYFFLHRRDWGTILSHPSVRIVITSKPEEILPLAHSLLPQIMGSGIRFIDHRPSNLIYADFYAGCVKCLRRFLQQAAAESEFLVQYGSLIQRNAILNLPAMCTSHGLGPLRDFYKDQPAVLIAAGPSLNKNLAKLIQFRSKVLVFCVDTAYSLVLKEGIIPDFVAATDPTELNERHFAGIKPRDDVVLLFESDVYPSIPRDWSGPMIFVNSEKAAINRWIEEIGGPFGCFDQGLSVAHTQFTAASWMGCNPIILAGHDFAYSVSGGSTHAKGTALNRKIQAIPKQGDTQAIIEKAAFHTENTCEEITWVLGVRGIMVPTSKTLQVLLNKFSDMVRRSPLTVFDASEDGALIEGTIPTQFQNILAGLEETKFAKKISVFLEENKDPQEQSRISAFQVLIQSMKNSLDKAGNGLSLTKKVENQFSANDKNSELIHADFKLIDQIFWELYRDRELQIVLEQALFSSMFMFIRRESNETLINRLKKYEQVFLAIINFINEFMPCLNESQSKLTNLCR